MGRHFYFPPSVDLVNRPSAELEVDYMVTQRLPVHTTLELSDHNPVRLGKQGEIGYGPSFSP